MNQPLRIFYALAAMALFASLFGAFVVQAQPAARAVPEAAVYKTLLGKSLDDADVAGFIASNRCSDVGQFQLCSDAGIALLMSQGQKVETVLLYPNQVAGFAAYKGTLPLGLSASDTMESIEYKLGQPRVQHAPQAGWEPGLPDETGTPDHFHTWATYKRFGVTIIYNTPSALDKGATIYAILVSR